MPGEAAADPALSWEKGKEMYRRLKEVYDDPGIPPEGRLPDPGEEGRKASYTYRITVRKQNQQRYRW